MSVHFPDHIVIHGETFTQITKGTELSPKMSGLNPKKIYRNQHGQLYIAKVEKERDCKVFEESEPPVRYRGLTLFASTATKKYALMNDQQKSLTLADANLSAHERHLRQLRDSATLMSVLASRIAKEIFPRLRVPENIMCHTEDRIPIVLSHIIPEHERFDEFLTKTKPVLDNHPVEPKDWKGHKPLPNRDALNLNMEQAKILGYIYYIALLLGHWDIVNNINLSNSGTVNIHGKLQPCIVDWGNCLGVGFGGLNQDATAFKNPEFRKQYNKNTDDILMGFIGAVPFDEIVYPRLPRQIVDDLFDLTSHNALSEGLLNGFMQAHHDAQKHMHRGRIAYVINTVFARADKDFQNAVNKPFLLGTAENPPELCKILEGRLQSLTHIVSELDDGKSLAEIANAQFETILASQNSERFRKARL